LAIESLKIARCLGRLRSWVFQLPDYQFWQLPDSVQGRKLNG
jgi:hypothetical protein